MPNIFNAENASPSRACFDFSHVAGELEESRKRLAAVFDTVQVGIVIIDAETHAIVDANPKAVEMIGTDREGMVGSVCHCFICPEETGHCPITDQGQRIDNAERQLLKANGDTITIVKTVARVNLHGRDHLIESFLDITDRKRAEEELKESEERYRDILENANDLIQSVDAKGNFIYVNNAWKRTLGYSDEDVASMNIFDVIKPCCQNHCATMFDELKSGARIPRVEVEFVAKDGRSIILEGSINCNTSSGRAISTRGIFRDITERKKMEAELTQSEDRYRKLFENAPEAILVQHEGRYVCANREACNLLGVESPEELIGHSIFSFVHPDYHAMVVERIQHINDTGEPSPLRESRMVQKDGTVIDVEAVATGIVFQGQQAIQVIIRDITERKQVEEQRRELNTRLEKMVEEKTRHLKEAQTKLIQSEKMATLGEVIAGAAHELNNPLAGILGAIQMLRSNALHHPIDPELMEGIDVLESIESAAVRCQKIVEDLVRFTTQVRCNFSMMDINEVLRDTLEIMSGPFAEQKITVQLDLDPEVPQIEGDFVKLLEVYVNLLQNAKSALPDGGSIDLCTALVKKYGEPLQVSVVIRDNGCGIPPQNLAKIFDPFFTTKPAGRGPGLGLTVCYGIVKRHGGDIDVRSTVGKGTEVTVTIPVRQRNAAS
ncbi:PAS domain-containing protein [Geomonas subterranea]|uniref:histidine kinase n=1 Tax=Geomonas subterranea TaxID=2847989 RepID=A0ABX8LC50_9BACT|nr:MULTISPECIES: PAS domain-containing sensor histidine kinase [Geomonas]QXE88999.1 PAS domain S-box protein [Geomonas subterranea]QXM08883.1 PAS domain S-box protein [Geomonas subterranea]